MQDWKCHKSNGVLYLFHKNDVYITCLDQQCIGALWDARTKHHLMDTELEDIHRKKDSPPKHNNSPQHLQDQLDGAQLKFLQDCRANRERLLSSYGGSNGEHACAAAGRVQGQQKVQGIRDFSKVSWR
jgi:hypothetical protein